MRFANHDISTIISGELVNHPRTVHQWVYLMYLRSACGHPDTCKNLRAGPTRISPPFSVLPKAHQLTLYLTMKSSASLSSLVINTIVFADFSKPFGLFSLKVIECKITLGVTFNPNQFCFSCLHTYVGRC